MLLPTAHCVAADARPQPKSAPEETAVKEAPGGKGAWGKMAKTVRVEEAGTELGRKVAGGGMLRAEAAVSTGAEALNG